MQASLKRWPDYLSLRPREMSVRWQGFLNFWYGEEVGNFYLQIRFKDFLFIWVTVHGKYQRIYQNKKRRTGWGLRVLILGEWPLATQNLNWVYKYTVLFFFSAAFCLDPPLIGPKEARVFCFLCFEKAPLAESASATRRPMSSKNVSHGRKLPDQV